MQKQGINNQTKLADKIGISRSQLSQMLSDTYNPTRTNVNKLAEALDLSVLDLFTEDENNEAHKGNRMDYKWNEYVNVKSVLPNKNFTVLETFAGAGGLALGLEKAGFSSAGAIELDKHAVDTLRQNRPNWNVLEGDIENFAENINEYIPETFDVLSGGYPCQAFSFAGKREGMGDVRGTLFYPYSRILHQKKPKIFIAENVRGLVNHDNGRTLDTMIEVFENEGYTVHWNILNAWNYDVAEKRERIVIIGIRNDLITQQKYPFAYPQVQSYRPVLRDVLKDVPESPVTAYSDKKKKVMELVPPGGCWINLPEDIAKEYMGASWYSGGGKRGMARRLSWDEPSLTLTTSPSQKQTERCHPDETRPFTTREYARIQSFPDEWEFSGGVGAIYKQIGNAVPVNLAKYIGLAVIHYLNQFD